MTPFNSPNALPIKTSLLDIQVRFWREKFLKKLKRLNSFKSSEIPAFHCGGTIKILPVWISHFSLLAKVLKGFPSYTSGWEMAWDFGLKLVLHLLFPYYSIVCSWVDSTVSLTESGLFFCCCSADSALLLFPFLPGTRSWILYNVVHKLRNDMEMEILKHNIKFVVSEMLVLFFLEIVRCYRLVLTFPSSCLLFVV